MPGLDHPCLLQFPNAFNTTVQRTIDLVVQTEILRKTFEPVKIQMLGQGSKQNGCVGSLKKTSEHLSPSKRNTSRIKNRPSRNEHHRGPSWPIYPHILHHLNSPTEAPQKPSSSSNKKCPTTTPLRTSLSQPIQSH